jgi:hypothetical protein
MGRHVHRPSFIIRFEDFRVEALAKPRKGRPRRYGLCCLMNSWSFTLICMAPSDRSSNVRT